MSLNPMPRKNSTREEDILSPPCSSLPAKANQQTNPWLNTVSGHDPDDGTSLQPDRCFQPCLPATQLVTLCSVQEPEDGMSASHLLTPHIPLRGQLGLLLSHADSVIQNHAPPLQPHFRQRSGSRHLVAQLLLVMIRATASRPQTHSSQSIPEMIGL